MKLALALVAALLAALALLLVVLTDRTDMQAPPALELTVGAPGPPVLALHGDPVGLSIEYPLLSSALGGGACPPPALARVLVALGTPTLRIGGDSQDQTAPAGTPPRPGTRDLPGGFWMRLACLERETRIPVVVGLNLAAGDPGWAATMAADARVAIPPGALSFELGNEPDIYGSHVPWWDGRALVHAPMPFATYRSRALALAAAIGPQSAIEGPDFASGRWVRAVPALARTLRLRTLDAHFYPLDACRSDAGATASALLSRAVQLKLDERVRIARDARALGLPAVISEANSVSCGGVRGVSDSPAAAVWALRLLITALRAGFASVRFHASGGAYDPFTVRGDRVTLRPLDLGLRAAAATFAGASTLRPIPSARALDGVQLGHRDGARTDVLSNYASAPRWVTLASLRAVAVTAVAARAPTVRASTVRPDGGRARVRLPANSVVAITIPVG